MTIARSRKLTPSTSSEQVHRTERSEAPNGWIKSCPECNTLLETANLPANGTAGVCGSCGAVYMTDPYVEPRLCRTQEWHDLCCNVGNEYIWDLRETVMARLKSVAAAKTRPSRSMARA